MDPLAERVAERFAEQVLSVAPNLTGAKFTIGRGARGPKIRLEGTGPVEFSEEELGWVVEPEKLKPRQFGELQLERRLLQETELPEGAVDAFKGSKSAFDRDDFSTVFAVNSVVVSGKFQGKGYGLALYLKALELVSSKGYWLVNDTKASTTGSAAATWKALFRYANKTLEGPPPPQELFDYENQKDTKGYKEFGGTGYGIPYRVVPTHRPAFCAFGLSGAGKKALAGASG